MKGERLQIRLPVELKVEAQNVAARRGITLSALVEKLLRSAVESDHILRKTGTSDDVEQV